MNGNPGMCMECDPSCASCVGGNADQCTRCTHPHAILKGVTFGKFHGECKYEAGFYVNPSDELDVKVCTPWCGKCDSNGDCMANMCQAGYMNDPNNMAKCIPMRVKQTLPQDYATENNSTERKYFDEHKTLKDCDANCKRCHGTATNCLMCDASKNQQLVYNGTTRENYCGCKSGFFEDRSSGTLMCQACSTANCAQCDNEDVCQWCASGRESLANDCTGEDKLLCPEGTWYDVATLACKDCSQACSTCAGSADNCLEFSGYATKLINFNPLSSSEDRKYNCAPGTGFTSTFGSWYNQNIQMMTIYNSGSHNQCIPCPENMKHCFYNLRAPGRTHYTQGSAAFYEESKNMEQGLCYSGYDVALDYSLGFQKPTVVCKADRSNQLCPRTNPKQGSFVNPMTGKCQDCDANCLTCEFFSKNCSSCVLGYHLEFPESDSEDNFIKCVKNTGTANRNEEINGGDYKIDVPCPLGCSTCNGDLINGTPTCLTCIDGRDAVDGVCDVHKSCMHRQVFYKNDGSGECANCNLFCKTCSGDKDSCLSCFADRVFDPINKKCVRFPHGGQFTSTEGNNVNLLFIDNDLFNADQLGDIKTVKCLDGCRYCEDENTCDSSSCLNSYTYNTVTERCDPVQYPAFTSLAAPYGKFWNWETQSEDDCHESCASCSGKANWCMDCANGYFKVHNDIFRRR